MKYKIILLIFLLSITILLVMRHIYKLKSTTYYFDNNATTEYIPEEVRKSVNTWMGCANPSNTLHILGKLANEKVEQCRNAVAQDLDVNSDEIYFTSGATESNNIIICLKIQILNIQLLHRLMNILAF